VAGNNDQKLAGAHHGLVETFYRLQCRRKRDPG
jgi:hypothetical protein